MPAHIDAPPWLTLVLDGTPRATGIFDQDGVCVAANRRFTQWVGASQTLSADEGAEELLGRAGYRRGPDGLYEGHGRAVAAELERIEGHAALFLDEVKSGPDPRLRGRFLSVASHDLRGALANVRSYASLLKSPRFGLDEKASRAVDTIARNADRALALSEDVFDALKAEVGSLRAEASPNAPAPLIESALGKVAPAAAEKQVTLEHAPLELPPAMLDPDRFSRAVSALLLHGIGRSEPGAKVGLVVSCDRVLRVEVWDLAPPLTPQGLAFAFDRDARVAQERKLATGFSLALAGALVRAQAGELGHRVDEQGRQAFFFTLPRA
jgi:two-component system OmpR family sensor kinase